MHFDLFEEDLTEMVAHLPPHALALRYHRERKDPVQLTPKGTFILGLPQKRRDEEEGQAMPLLKIALINSRMVK